MAIFVDTDHGVYDVLPVEDGDGSPDEATHAVFHEGGALAGYVDDVGAWDAAGVLFAWLHSVEANARAVAEFDRDAVLAAYGTWPVADLAAARVGVIRDMLTRRYRGAIPVTDDMVAAVLAGLDDQAR